MKAQPKTNINKLQYKSKHDTFFGTTFTSDGHKPESEKLQAINKITQQTHVKDLQHTLGVVNY